MPINNGIINQKGTPAFYSDIFANRPAFGYAGRVFISTDTGAIYEDTGSAWTLIADAGAGTTGTLQQVTTNGNTTTLGVTIQGIDINDGAGTGTENTAIGKSSLNNNTTGINNTALGSYSLGFNTTGNNNTALGVNSLITNTTGASNTAVGVNALTSNTTASFNTSIGASSLQLNTTGVNNVAIGYGTLQTNTTGSANTGVGYLSLSANTTAGSNTSIGHEALRNNTTGAQNTAIGHQALRINTTGQYNVSIGQDSLANNIIGSNNTAIGQGSLRNNTADNNTSIGFSSLNVNTTGANNSAVGSGALSLNTTGINNTAIGQSSLAANITGSYNVALGVGTLGNNLGSYNVGIGHSSLNAVTTGTNNSAIGYASGSAITTGSNNTIIGAYGGTTTLASNIVLSDGAGNVRLFSDANGLIGINQAVGSTIGGQLDIHSTQTYALVLNGLSTSNAYTAFSNANVGKWRIGNTYNAGANSFDIFNLGTSSTALSFNSTTNAGTFIAGITATEGKFSLDGGTEPTYTTGTAGKFIKSASGVFGGVRIALVGGSSGGDNGIDFYNTSTIVGQFGYGAGGQQFYFDKGVNMATTSGNVGIGTTTPDFPLTIKTDASANSIKILGRTIGSDTSISWNSSNNATQYGRVDVGASYFQIIATNSQSIQLYTGGNERIFISNAGAITFSNLAGTGSRAVLADASGTLSAPVSDISVKINISTIGYGLSEILKMNPVWFNYINEYKNFGNGRQNGNIAQEMEAIIPEAVFTTPTTGKMGINYDQLHAVYIKAIQELKAEIDALKNN